MTQSIQIYVNGSPIDIDESTAVGITFNGFDFQNAGNIHLSYSNQFTLPLTKANRRAFGFVDSMSVNSATIDTKLYSSFLCRMYVNGVFILDGKIYVDEISDDRISVYMLSNKDFTDTMKDLNMFDVTKKVVNKLNAEIQSSFPNGANFADIVDYMSTADENVWIPYTVGTLFKQYPYAKTDGEGKTVGNLYEDTDNDSDKEQYNIDNETKITTEFITNSVIVGNYKSGHIYVKLRYVLETAFSLFGFTPVFDSSILESLNKQFIRMQDIILQKNVIDGSFRFAADNSFLYKIGGSSGASSESLSFLDLFKTVCLEWCLTFDIDNTKTIHFHTMNDIKDSTVKTYPSGEVKSRSFKYDGLKKLNWIRYDKSGDGNAYAGGLQFPCYNDNIEGGSSDLVNIKRMICGYLAYMYEGTSFVNIQTYSLNTSNDSDVNSSFVIVQKEEGQTPFDVTVQRVVNGQTTIFPTKLYRALQSVAGNSGFWDFFSKNCEYPETITIDVYIKPFELLNFSSFQLARFTGVAGLWYVQKISGWNPRQTSGTVTVSAVRVR